MRISDWSSDVCSSDLPPVGCDHASVHRHWRILIAPASALVPSAIIPKHVPHPARHAPPAHKDMAVRSCTPTRPWPAPLRCARRVGARRRGSPPSDLQPHPPCWPPNHWSVEHHRFPPPQAWTRTPHLPLPPPPI